MGTNFQEIDAEVTVANKESQKEKISDLSNYTYCMISTLNQMVNYLPMLLFPQMTDRLYITIMGGKAGDKNKTFDEALSKTCIKTRIDFPTESEWLKLESPYSTEAIKSDIESSINAHKEKKIFWNITGGQRPIVMAITELAKKRQGDLVGYLEGNEGKLIVLKSDCNGNFIQEDFSENGTNSYAITGSSNDKLNIPNALRLMGFTDKVNTMKWKNNQEEGSYESFLTTEKPNSEDFLSLIDKYKNNEILRKKLLALNKQSDYQEGDITYHTKCILKDSRECGEYFSELTPAELNLILYHKSRVYPFGHLLEEFFTYAIWNTGKGHIADIGTNIRLRYENETVDKEAGEKQIDELDIAVLTKTGQLVVFEVKSGDMHSDVAKSTKYTTYAIAGVYGKPVLLTALLKSQFPKIGELRKDQAYSTSASAFQSAQRAQLSIIALDGDKQNDFETAIKNLLNINSKS